jgi:hypothetical protein
MTSTETHLIPDDVESLARYARSARSAIGAWREFLAQQVAHDRSPAQAQQTWLQAADLLDKQGHDFRAQAMRDAPEKHAQGVDVGGRRPARSGQPHETKRKDFSVYGLGAKNLELLTEAAKEAGVSRNELVKQYLRYALRQDGFDPEDPTDVETSDN